MLQLDNMEEFKMARPRKQTYTLEMYLKKNRKGDIDNNADVQRCFVWSNEQINELIVTVLTDDYIPPIILGEEDNSKLHIVDGGCRTVALIKFRYMNYKITSSIENSLIPYKKKIIEKDKTITYEDALFDIKNKTYEKLPEELREKFDEYQIETVIHEACNSSKISKYIKRYNNHVSMNTDQKAFTYIDKYANRIRKILNNKFFVECNSYAENDKIKGVTERIVVESMMCMNHFEHWKKQPKISCKYLNENATEDEFNAFENNLHRLEAIITDDIKDIFNKKDSFIFLTLFDRFIKLGVDDIQFANFLREFKMNLRRLYKNEKGFLFDEIDKDASTKSKQVIFDKLDMLQHLMEKFVFSDDENERKNVEKSFIAEVLDMDAEMIAEEIDYYNEVLDTLLENRVKVDSKLCQQQNRLSLLAMIVYSYKKDVDIDLENWLEKYAARNNIYFVDQKKNFYTMLDSFKNYLHMKNEQKLMCG